MWLTLRDRVPTWDFMQRKSWQVLGRCALCKVCEESYTCLFPFLVLDLWKEMEGTIGIRNLWRGLFVNDCLDYWRGNVSLNP